MTDTGADIATTEDAGRTLEVARVLQLVPLGETSAVELRAVLATYVARLWDAAGVPLPLYRELAHLPVATLAVSLALYGPEAAWLHEVECDGLTPMERLALLGDALADDIRDRASDPVGDDDDLVCDVESLVAGAVAPGGVLTYDPAHSPCGNLLCTAQGIEVYTRLLGHPLTALQVRMAGALCPPRAMGAGRAVRWRLGDALAYSARLGLREVVTW